MAHPRKKRRTQQPGTVNNATANGVTQTNSADRTPKSMVIRMGASDVGSSITQLVKDMRVVMEPHTAIRLRERRSNRLRDYTTMAGPLGVSHLLLFSRSSSGNTNMRLAITPRGPTLNFRVDNYSLCKDVAKSQRHPKTTAAGVQHLTPPLLVMNNFTSTATSESNAGIPKHLESLATSVFQSLFPPISPQRTPLSSIRRVLLLNRETVKRNSSSSSDSTSEGSYVLSLRHYAITTKPLVSISRGLKRLRAAEQHSNIRKSKPITETSRVSRKSKGDLPDMSRFNDVADFLLDPSAAGYTSASETEVDTDAEVEVMEMDARKVLSKHEKQRQRDARSAAKEAEDGETPTRQEGKPSRSRVQKRAVRLTELGPRMRLRLVKVEEGLCTGKVMWHEFVTKSQAEEKDMEKMWDRRNQEKAERQRVQKENLDKKKQARGGAKAANGDDGDEEEDMDGDLEDEDWDEYDQDADMAGGGEASDDEMEE